MIHATILRGAFDKTPVAQDDFDTWDEVANELEALTLETYATKTGMLAFHFGRLDAPHNVNAEILEHTALVIDVDRVKLVDLVERIDASGIAALVYGSPSDDARGPADARRVRVCAPISRALQPDEVKQARHAFAESIGIGPKQGVEGADAISQLFFVGRIKGTPEREVWRFTGDPVDVDKLPTPAAAWRRGASATTSALAPLPRIDATPDERTTALLTAIAPHWEAPGQADSRRPTLRGLGGYLAKRGWGDSQIAAVCCGLETARPEEERLKLMIDAARQARQDPGATAGWSTLTAWSPDAARVIEATAKDPLEPEGWTGVWSEWWSRAYSPRGWVARMAKRFAGREPRTLALADDDEGTANAMALDVTRQGTPRPHVLNATIIMQHVIGERIRFDDMRGRILCADIDDSLGEFPDGLWTDAHTIELGIMFNGMQLHVSKNVVNDAVIAHAKCHAFNPLRDWLIQAARRWDGAARVDDALVRYWGAPATAATRATSRVLMLSLAARGLEPGCKVDTCPILVGTQGIYKSSSLRALAGGDDMFADSPLQIGDKEALQNIRGKWLWELSELASLSRRDQNAVKAFLSTRQDTFRASYGHFTEDVPRTCVFVATSNETDILRDHTGARRFLPVHVFKIDMAGIERDREQLLGEAARRVLDDEPWWPSDAEDRALAGVREEHHEHDVWEDLIVAWLEKRQAKDEGPFTTADVFDEVSGAVRTRDVAVGMAEQKRAGSVLRRMGFERYQARSGDRRGVYLWRAGCEK